MKPSKEYYRALEDSKAIHAAGKSFTGRFVRSHAGFIKEIIDRLGCKTVLDYGCGRGEQYDWIMPKRGIGLEEWWGVEVAKYDPGYFPFSEEPKTQFDLVICTQTLNQIPITDIPWVINRLYSLANKAIYISERLQPTRKIIGIDALRPSLWSASDWLEAIYRFSPLEVTVALRAIMPDDQKITKHWRWANGSWSPVVWPESVKFLNHENA